MAARPGRAAQPGDGRLDGRVDLPARPGRAGPGAGPGRSAAAASQAGASLSASTLSQPAPGSKGGDASSPACTSLPPVLSPHATGEIVAVLAQMTLARARPAPLPLQEAVRCQARSRGGSCRASGCGSTDCPAAHRTLIPPRHLAAAQAGHGNFAVADLDGLARTVICYDTRSGIEPLITRDRQGER